MQSFMFTCGTGAVVHVHVCDRCYHSGSFVLYNPLRPIGSPVTHENLPTNWPNFAASPALLCWPARNRHTAACIHRFSHILGRPPEPVVWFMSESRAVANEHEGYKQTLSIISSSFRMAVGVKGLSDKIATNCRTSKKIASIAQHVRSMQFLHQHFLFTGPGNGNRRGGWEDQGPDAEYRSDPARRKRFHFRQDTYHPPLHHPQRRRVETFCHHRFGRKYST